MPLTRQQIEAIAAQRGDTLVDAPTRNRRAELEAAWNMTPPEKTFGQKALGVAKTVGGALISSEKKLGETLGDIIGMKLYGDDIAKANMAIADADLQYVKTITDLRKQAEAEGRDTAHWDNLIKNYKTTKGTDLMEVFPSLKKTNKQVLGEVAGVGLDVLSAGAYGAATKGMKAATIGKTIPQVLPPAGSKLAAMGKGFVTGAKQAAPLGVGYGAAYAAQEDKSGADIAKSGLIGGLVSGVLGGTIGAITNRKNIDPKALKQEAIDQYKKGLMLTKEKYREKADKLIPDLLEEGTWGSKKKLLEKAEKGIKLSQDDYAKLGELQGVADITDIATQIDDEIAKYSQGGKAAVEKIKTIQGQVNNQLQSAKQLLIDPDSAAMLAKSGGEKALIRDARTNIVDGLRKGYGLNDVADAIENNIDLAKMDSIDEYSRAINSILDNYRPKPISVNVERVNALKGLKNDIASLQLYNQQNPTAYKEDLRKLTQQYGADLYDSRKAQKTINDSKTLSQIKKIDSSLRELLNTSTPEYSKINKVYHLNSELFDIIEEAAKNEKLSVFGKLKDKLTEISTAGGLALVGSAGGLTPAVILGASGAGLATLMKSTWYNSLRAVQKYALAQKLEGMAAKELSDLMIQVYRQGPAILQKYTEQED